MRTAAVVLLLAITAACGPSEPIKASAIQLGRSLNSDDSINQHTTTFKPDDTIYVSVINATAGKGTIHVRWRYNSNTVAEEEKTVSYNREGATEFHMTTPSAGFPEGNYRVEVTVNGENAGFRDFRVVR